MKRLIRYIGYIIICYLIALVLFVSCNDVKGSTAENVDNQERRIKVEYETRIGGTTFYILNVDGKEYLTQYQGGITPLIKE